MRARSLPTLMAVATLAMSTLAACGGGDDGSKALSDDEFVDELTDICSDASRDLDRIEEPTGSDFSDAAAEAKQVFEETLERLRAITPPEGASRDYESFIGNIEDQLRAADRLGEASDDEEVNAAFERLSKLSDEQSEIARDLDVDECDPSAGDTTEPTVPETTTEALPATTVATTAAPTTVAPATTAAPITLPTTVPPTPTDPPATAPPTGPTFEIIDLTAENFVAPDGFYLVPKTPDQATIDLIATLPELNEKLLQLGVATLVESGSDLEVADIWLGLSVTDSMPADWKTLDCPTGDLRESGNGILGIVCEAALESPFWEIFTATDADIGISVYTRVPDISGDLVADAFLEAN